jgi:hypothetical protein
LIDAFLLADEANLEKARKLGAKHFKLVLDYSGGTIVFSESQIEKLVPLIAQENLMESTPKEKVLSPFFPE